MFPAVDERAGGMKAGEEKTVDGRRSRPTGACRQLAGKSAQVHLKV
jgi:hypothetical protein